MTENTATSPRGPLEHLVMPLAVTPITLAEANAFVAAKHRHHKPTAGHIASLAVSDGETVRGVAIVGRPVARMLDDGWTAEVLRCCTDGTRNACSMLYGAAWRAVRALGYRKLVTYTLPDEGGASLRAAGFRCIGEAGGGSWSRKERPRVDTHPTQAKLRWERHNALVNGAPQGRPISPDC